MKNIEINKDHETIKELKLKLLVQFCRKVIFMKKIYFLLMTFFFIKAWAIEKTSTTLPVLETKTEAQKLKVTVTQAKEACRVEGKTSGDSLLKCIDLKQKEGLQAK